MDFVHIKLFKDIANTKSISRAAQLHGISQSAATQRVQELEKTLKVRLLDRGRRPLVLTDAGRLFYDFCREVLRHKEDFDVSLDRLKGRLEGVVRVASIYSVGISELSHLEQVFSSRLPSAELRIEYLRPERIYEVILSEQADLGLLSYPEASRDIKVIPWREEEMVVAVSPGHSLAAKERVEPVDLTGEDYVGFDDDLPISRGLKRFFREHRVEVNPVMHFDNIQMIKEAVALGSGVSILPACALRFEIAQGRLVAVPLAPPGLRRPLGIIHLRRKRFNQATLSFLHLLKEEPLATQISGQLPVVP